MQSYYTGDLTNNARLKTLSSAPNVTTISIKLSDTALNNIPKYSDIEIYPHNNFNYFYFVVDWDDIDDYINMSNVSNYFLKLFKILMIYR